MAINWDVLVAGPGGVVIPTYGNYGGPGYSNGEVLVGPDQQVDYTAPPVDVLDAAFRLHDMAYDAPDPLVRAGGDVALVHEIEALSMQPQDAEASLYGGGAILFGLEQASLANGHPELVSLPEATNTLVAAAGDIRAGIDHLSPGEWANVATCLEGSGASGPMAAPHQAGAGAAGLPPAAPLADMGWLL